MLPTQTTTTTFSSLRATALRCASPLLKRFHRRSAFRLIGSLALTAVLFMPAPSTSAKQSTAHTPAHLTTLTTLTTPTRFIAQSDYHDAALRLRAVRHTTHVHTSALTVVRRIAKPLMPPPPPPPPAPVVVDKSAGFYAASMEFCHDSWRFPASISQWTVPVGCYSGIYNINTAAYPYRPSPGWCNWWPEEVHPGYGGYSVLNLPGHSTPIVGAVVWFAPYVQGAGDAGHYANVVAIGPDGWLLISEMNFYWRGGGFGRVDYRYIHTGYGVSFRY